MSLFIDEIHLSLHQPFGVPCFFLRAHFLILLQRSCKKGSDICFPNVVYNRNLAYGGKTMINIVNKNYSILVIFLFLLLVNQHF